MQVKLLFVRIFIFISAPSFLLYSCNSDCASEVCPPPISSAFYIRLQNSAGSDLLAGPEKRYDTSEVRIYARRQNQIKTDTITRDFIVLKNRAGTADSLVSTGFPISKSYNVYYLSIKNVITDSLYFGLKPSPSECCDLSNYFLDRVNNLDVNNLGLPVSYVIVK